MAIRLPDNCSCQWFAALRLGARISLVRLKGADKTWKDTSRTCTTTVSGSGQRDRRLYLACSC